MLTVIRLSVMVKKWFDVFDPKNIKSIQALLKHVSDENMYNVLRDNIAPHNCKPFHLESIDEHINMTIRNGFNENCSLGEEAMFHDLGKSICKEFTSFAQRYIIGSALIGHVINNNELEDLQAHYKNHANVSAQLYLNYMYSNDKFTAENWMILKAITQHMNAHQGMGPKNIRKNKLDDELLNQIEEFRKIDDSSRKVY